MVWFNTRQIHVLLCVQCWSFSRTEQSQMGWVSHPVSAQSSWQGRIYSRMSWEKQLASRTHESWYLALFRLMSKGVFWDSWTKIPVERSPLFKPHPHHHGWWGGGDPLYWEMEIWDEVLKVIVDFIFHSRNGNMRQPFSFVGVFMLQSCRILCAAKFFLKKSW